MSRHYVITLTERQFEALETILDVAIQRDEDGSPCPASHEALEALGTVLTSSGRRRASGVVRPFPWWGTRGHVVTNLATGRAVGLDPDVVEQICLDTENALEVDEALPDDDSRQRVAVRLRTLAALAQTEEP